MLVFKISSPKYTGRLMGVPLYNGIFVKLKGEYFTPYFTHPTLMEKLVSGGVYYTSKALSPKIATQYKKYLELTREPVVLVQPQMMQGVDEKTIHTLADITLGVLRVCDDNLITNKELYTNSSKLLSLPHIVSVFYMLFNRVVNNPSTVSYNVWVFKDKGYIPLIGLEDLAGFVFRDKLPIVIETTTKEFWNLLKERSEERFKRLGYSSTLNINLSPTPLPYWFGVHYDNYDNQVVRIYIANKNKIIQLFKAEKEEIPNFFESHYTPDPVGFINNNKYIFIPESDGSVLGIEVTKNLQPREIFMLPKQFKQKHANEFRKRLSSPNPSLEKIISNSSSQQLKLFKPQGLTVIQVLSLLLNTPL